MTLVRYEPWGLVNRLHQQINHVFGDNVGTQETPSQQSVSWIPRVDVYEETDKFVVLADVPGVEPKDIEITAEKGVLTVKGERKTEKKSTGNGYERTERASGSFVRRFTLPESAQTDSITAKHTNGVLEVSIPKQAQVQPRRIEIQAA